MIGNTVIQIPKPFSSKQSLCQQQKFKKAQPKRASIEPIIGHLTAGHRLNRNLYKGFFGNNINIMLAAAAFNFKRMMNKWKTPIFGLIQNLIDFLPLNLNQIKSMKIAF